MPRDGDYIVRPYDFAAPDYVAEFTRRANALHRIRRDPASLPALKAYYREHPAQFISDWGITYDPRNVEVGRPALIPFVLFPRQVEWVEFALRKWRAREPAGTEKSRDCGITWLAVALSCTLCLFYHGMAIGFGSRKEEYVDKIGARKSILQKGRDFMSYLPVEFRGGWTLRNHAPHMRLIFPETDSTMVGEAGDNIGRGDRAAIYWVDEAAHLEHPEQVDAALSQTTNCQHDISSVKGMANSFAIKRHGGNIEFFVFDWKDDPRKDLGWYEKQTRELDPVILAQEVDRDYHASVEGIVIPAIWVRAALDAHVKLNIKPTGQRTGSLDVADEGKDLNAMIGVHGVVVFLLEEWSGKDSDTFATTERAFALCDSHAMRAFRYDADGLGAAVRGDARVLNQGRGPTRRITVEGFRGSGAVEDPEDYVEGLGDPRDGQGRTNQDFFFNAKAQAWWMLRRRFKETFRAVVEGKPYDPDAIISIPSSLRLHRKLMTELSQPTYAINTLGKIVVDKAPNGAKSPNLADACMMQYSRPWRRGMRISTAALEAI